MQRVRNKLQIKQYLTNWKVLYTLMVISKGEKQAFHLKE